MSDQGKYRILIVDDDEDVRLLVKTGLQAKYEVVCAHDGLDALEKMERYEPDMIIMDMVMPLMDGLQACQAIRRNPKYKNLQVIFLSAHNSRDEVMKSYESGANLFLPKPIEPSRLVRNVDMYFEQTPPPFHPKRMSIRQIEIVESLAKGKPSSPEAVNRNTPNAYDHREPVQPVSLPPRSVPAPSITPSSPTARQTASSEHVSNSAIVPRVLLVEDDKDLSQLVSMALSERFEVVQAIDGMDAVEKMVKYQPDLLIIDVMLPKMNGYQLCQSVRSNSSYNGTPIIILTAKSTAKDREYAMRVGANLFLTKPVEMKQLEDYCLTFVQNPEFRARPKKLSVFDIRAEQAQEEILQKQRDERLKRIGRDLDDVFGRDN